MSGYHVGDEIRVSDYARSVYAGHKGVVVAIGHKPDGRVETYDLRFLDGTQLRYTPSEIAEEPPR